MFMNIYCIGKHLLFRPKLMFMLGNIIWMLTSKMQNTALELDVLLTTKAEALFKEQRPIACFTP